MDKLDKLLQENAVFNSSNKDAEKLVLSIKSLKDCPTCKQDVNQNQYNRLAGMMGVKQSEAAGAKNAYERQRAKFGQHMNSAIAYLSSMFRLIYIYLALMDARNWWCLRLGVEAF